MPRLCQKYIARVSFAAPSFPSYTSWSGHGRIAWLLPRASPLAPTYAPSHARYAISCHVMYTHTPMVLQQMPQHSQHQSTARIRVPSGPFGLAEQGFYCLNTSSSSRFFRQGGNAWNLFDFGNQSAAFFWVDTIKYYSIPSVPSGLEGVKTRPDTYQYTSTRTTPVSPFLIPVCIRMTPVSYILQAPVLKNGNAIPGYDTGVAIS